MKKYIDCFKQCRVIQILVFCIILIPSILLAADLLPGGQILDFSVPPPKDTSLVPPADWGDVIGNPNDGHGANTLAGFLNEIREHLHEETQVYPTLADCVTVTSGAGDWQLGSFTQIVPINTITQEFDIHQIFVEDYNTSDKTYELVLYQGDNDVEIGRMRFRVNDGTPVGRTLSSGGQFQTPLILENKRIRAKLAIEDGGSKTACISIRYHTY
jgi:hypothetical protein